MKGLELSRWYYQEMVVPLIHNNFYEYENRIAVGLAGEGSQCYGYDDELSQDHDWGANICLWLTKEDYEKIGMVLEKGLEELPKKFHGYPCANISSLGGGRTGVMTIDFFYKKFLAVSNVPKYYEEWRIIPEHHLAAATNGAVFRDDLGKFSFIRNGLLKGYPEDVRKKKIAYYCLQSAQSGQYNLPRIVKRGDYVAAQLALVEFMKNSIVLVYLLHNRYAPYYKWLFQGLDKFLEPDDDFRVKYADLCENSTWKKKIMLTEEISQQIINVLQSQKLTDSRSDFLLEHGYEVYSRIEDTAIKRINPWIL